MTTYRNIDRKTLKWVGQEIDASLEEVRAALGEYLAQDSQSALMTVQEGVHQTLGSLQMLELQSLAALLLETERFIAQFGKGQLQTPKARFSELCLASFDQLESSLQALRDRKRESPVVIVELLNKIRLERGEEQIEVSSLFSPFIDVFPAVNPERALKDEEYILRARALRKAYQAVLLKWIGADVDGRGVHQINLELIADKLLQMSSFGVVARLWSVFKAYVEFLGINHIDKRQIHIKILREVDDRLRSISEFGESALVGDPAEELVRAMLFYVGSAQKVGPLMREVIQTYDLLDYFPSQDSAEADLANSSDTIKALKGQDGLVFSQIRKQVTEYFDRHNEDSSLAESITSIGGLLENTGRQSSEHEPDVVADLLVSIERCLSGLQIGEIEASDEIAFHMASSLLFVENSLSDSARFDEFWVENGHIRNTALQAILAGEEVPSEMDGAHLTGSERSALLQVVSQEVEQNLSQIESKLEQFALDTEQPEVLEGIDSKIRQIRGALQVIGEQRVGLLLQLAEEQFAGLASSDIEPSGALIEALAVSVETLDEYVNGLISKRQNLTSILDRAIADLEVAIGKEVSRDDVESLMEGSSESLFAWLADQSDFDNFTALKSNLRDMSILARKTKLEDVEHMVGEQNRLVDVISQEPAFLNDNIKTTLQSNMADISAKVIALYGTEASQEELATARIDLDEQSEIEDDESLRIHDESKLDELSNEIDFDALEQSNTEQDQGGREVDPAILEIFKEESREVLDRAYELSEKCHEDHSDRESCRDLRRQFHTLKGSARMVGLDTIGELAWFSESVFNYILDTERPLTQGALDFGDSVLETFESHLKDGYENQHEIDVEPWAQRMESLVRATTTDQQHSDSQDANDESVEAIVIETSDEAEFGELDLSASVEDNFDESEFEMELDASFLSVDSSLIAEGSNNAEGSFDAEGSLEKPIDDEPQEQENQEAVSNDQDAQEGSIDEGIDFIDTDDLVEIDLETASVSEISGSIDLMSVSELDGLSELSFHAIEQPEMREVFLQEGAVTLKNIVEALEQQDTSIHDDSALVVGLHTLLGNARTLGFAGMASAYKNAEELCNKLNEDGLVLARAQKNLLLELAPETEKSFKRIKDYDDGFALDDEAWESLATRIAQAEELEDDAADDEAQEREAVSQLFDKIENFDDLLDDDSTESVQVEVVDGPSEKADSENADIELDDDLQEMEVSLQSLRSDAPQGRESDAETAQQSESVETESDKASHEERAESLLSADLANLLQDEINSPDQDVEINLPNANANDTSDAADEGAAEEDAADPSEADDLVAQTEGQASDVDQEESDKVEIDQAELDPLEQELKDIFLEEAASLSDELDNSIADLNQLSEAAPLMSEIKRHLHTLKGSSRMANANLIGNLTHEVEGYLENQFIRDDESLGDVKNVLEHYVDELNGARRAYASGLSFDVNQSFLDTLGIERSLIDEVGESNQIFSDLDASLTSANEASQASAAVELDQELLAAINQARTGVEQQLNGWKSPRGWSRKRKSVIKSFDSYQKLSDEPLESRLPIFNAAQMYVEGLSVKTKAEQEQAKTLIKNANDQISQSMKQLIAGETIDSDNKLIERLTNRGSVDAVSSDQVSVAQTPISELQSASAQGPITDPIPFKAPTKKQQESDTSRNRDRAAALRIETGTLDSLTHYVGDSSMNRSQMREDVLSAKTRVDDLFQNIRRFGSQLRELEIEADSQIRARANQEYTQADSDEFDPLEMDRYTKLQQLSRSLTENLDELGTIQTSLNQFVHKAETSLQNQDRLNRELQDEIMQVRMVAFGEISPSLRQIVRQTARELGKAIDIKILGGEVRLDKTILDSIQPALEHMLRNAVDHGIEDAKQRKSKGKKKQGEIVVECAQVAREIIIRVRDDGRGLDLDQIQRKAVASGIITPDHQVKPQEAMVLISQSGFSTASQLTQVSGRGIGMDVVQDILRRLSGNISYEYGDKGVGSLFTIRLPISLAVTSAMFIDVAGSDFAIMTRMIDRIINLSAVELRMKKREADATIDVDGIAYKLIDLADYLRLGSRLEDHDDNEKLPVILAQSGAQNMAVLVDELGETQEIVVNELGDHLGSIPIYSGATYRPNGQVVLLLDLVGLSFFESLSSLSDRDTIIQSDASLVMVVDDSLTVRRSSERDLTQLGLDVVLARDGLDAQTQLQTHKPDMILLDIEMPNMDGFEFLAWLRSEDSFKDIPVAMISSRATDKYVEKATELGSNAFLGKPYLIEDLVEQLNANLELAEPLTLDKD